METDRDQELAALRIVAAALPWTFARTVPKQPHEYVVRGHTVPEDIHARLARAIRHYGADMKFGPWRNRYLFLGDGYKYWASPRIRSTVIINRDTVLNPKDWPGQR
jgi:hypothetical protein